MTKEKSRNPDIVDVEEISTLETERLPRISVQKGRVHAWEQKTDAQKLEERIARRKLMRESRQSFGDRDEFDKHSLNSNSKTSSESSLSSLSSSPRDPEIPSHPDMASSQEGKSYLRRKEQSTLPAIKQSTVQASAQTIKYKQELRLPQIPTRENVDQKPDGSSIKRRV